MNFWKIFIDLHRITRTPTEFVADTRWESEEISFDSQEEAEEFHSLLVKIVRLARKLREK